MDMPPSAAGCSADCRLATLIFDVRIFSRAAGALATAIARSTADSTPSIGLTAVGDGLPPLLTSLKCDAWMPPSD